MPGGNPAIQGDPSDVKVLLERHELRAIMSMPWSIYPRIRTDQRDAVLDLGFVRVYIDRETAILARD